MPIDTLEPKREVRAEETGRTSETAPDGKSLVHKVRNQVRPLLQGAGNCLQKLAKGLQTIGECHPYAIIANGGRRARNRHLDER